MCTSSCPGADRAGLGEALDETGQGVVGDGQQHQVGALEDVRGGDERDVREEQRRPPPGGVGDSGDGHRAVPGELEGRSERRSHPAGADDADGEPRGAVLAVWLLGCTHASAAFPFQSASGYRTISRHVNAIGSRGVRLSTGCGFPSTVRAEMGMPGPGAHEMIRA
ncbi:hypothetical protein RKD25_003700 [Streptomyces sp. SAI-124]